MDDHDIILMLLVAALFALGLRVVVLFATRRPVVAHLVSSDLPDHGRISHGAERAAIVGRALGLDDDAPMERVRLVMRYTIDGRRHLYEGETVIRRGERAPPTMILWYDPADPARATDRVIGWRAMVLAGVALALAALDLL